MDVRFTLWEPKTARARARAPGSACGTVKEMRVLWFWRLLSMCFGEGLRCGGVVVVEGSGLAEDGSGEDEGGCL